MIKVLEAPRVSPSKMSICREPSTRLACVTAITLSALLGIAKLAHTNHPLPPKARRKRASSPPPPPLPELLNAAEPFIIVRCMHGLGNRLRAFASVKAIADATGRRLAVLWDRDIHLNASWASLFEAVPGVLIVSADDNAIRSRKDVHYVRLMLGSDATRRRSGPLSIWEKMASTRRLNEEPQSPPPRHLFVKTSRLVSHTDLGFELTDLIRLASSRGQGSGCSTRCRLQLMVSRNLLQLKPVAEVRSRLEQLTRSWATAAKLPRTERLSDHLIAVHVRMAHNLSEDVPSIERTRDPSLAIEAMADMPQHRRRCSWQNFVPHAREALREMTPSPPMRTVVYVAADTRQAARSICRAIEDDSGGSCVTLPDGLLSPCFGLERRGAACTRVALLELYLLASARTLIFSDASSYSSIALMLGRSAGGLASARSGCMAPSGGAAISRNESFVEGMTTRPVRDVRVWWPAYRLQKE